MNTTHDHVAPEAVPMNLDVHPILRKTLRKAAIDEDLTVKEKVHRILCAELGRPDLVDQVPVCVRGRRKATGSQASPA